MPQAEIASGLIGLLRSTANNIGALKRDVAEGMEIEDVFGDVLLKYRRYCKRNYRAIQILGMTRPVDLTQIYTEVAIREDLQRHRSASEKELIREVLAAGHQDDKVRLSATDAAINQKRVVLLGRPGSGKSTFTKHLLLNQIDAKSFVYQFPILIQINQLALTGRTIVEEIAHILGLAGLKFPEAYVAHMLKEGRFRILLDGLDEARQAERSKIIDEVQDLSRRHADCSFLITSRSAAYDFWFQDFHHFEVVDFSASAIEGFVRKWFKDDPERAEDLLDQMSANRRIQELCSNPLMLTIVCIGFREGSGVSANRSEIYKESIDALLKSWDASRRIKRDDPYKELTPKRRLDLLCDLAARTFSNGEVVFSDNRAKDVVTKFLSTLPTEKDPYDCGDVLDSMEAQHGLIVRRSRSFWSFAHLTFQEYFTAQYIIQREGELFREVVRRNLTRPDWREVLILIACLLPNADDYVLDLLRAMTRLGYGKFFVDQVNKEIGQASLSAEHRRQDSSWLFDPSDEATDSKRPRLSLIEGGLSPDAFSVDQARLVIEHFRAQSARRLTQVMSLGLWYRPPRERPDADAGSITPEMDEGRFAVRMDRIYQNIVRSRDAPNPRLIDPRYGSSLRRATLEAIQKLVSSNVWFPGQVSRALSPSAVFEITDRKFTHVVPKCLDICFQELTSLFNRLSFRGLLVIFKDAKLPGRPADWLDTFKAAFLDELRQALAQVAQANEAEVVRLRALSAGEVLADILSSDVCLSKRVRLAAVRTLGNLIVSGPEPPPEVTGRGAARVGLA